MTEPTDAEIFVVAREAGLLPDNSHPAPETRVGRKHSNAVQAFARAVLDKWGAPAYSGDPVAWLDPWTGAKVTTDYDAYGKHGIPLYTAPQPVEREPLTDAQITAAAKKLAECMDYPWDYMNYPGQAEMRKHAQAVVEAAHGIKGGQHGTDQTRA